MAYYIPQFLLCLAVVSSTVGDPLTHVYAPECEPPPGLPQGSSNATTTALYPTMAPIERCCPQCSDCVDLGGQCMIKWVTELVPQWCDFETTQECKDYGCRCCVKCGDDTCSPCVQTGGECRAECRADELEDTENLCQFHNNGTGCKCCKKCEATSECTDVNGKCVTNPNDCPLGSFPSTGCCGGCFCCKPVMQDAGGCSDEGSYCSETDECATGYYANFGACLKTVTVAGLESTELGYCCVAKATAAAPPPGRRDMMYQQNLNQAAGGRPPYGAAAGGGRPPYGRRHPQYLD